MKTFEATQEVKDRIAALFLELHHLCLDNGIPYIAGCVTKATPLGHITATSAHLDGAVDLAPSHLIAAFEMMKLGNVPREVIEAIREMDEPGECDCEACQLARSAAAGLH